MSALLLISTAAAPAVGNGMSSSCRQRFKWRNVLYSSYFAAFGTFLGVNLFGPRPVWCTVCQFDRQQSCSQQQDDVIQNSAMQHLLQGCAVRLFLLYNVTAAKQSRNNFLFLRFVFSAAQLPFLFALVKPDRKVDRERHASVCFDLAGITFNEKKF